MAADRLDMRFAGKILKEEWDDFEKRHRDTIERRIYQRQRKQSSGALRKSRDYTVKLNNAGLEHVATLSYPYNGDGKSPSLYERFIDMKKNFIGKRGGKKVFQNRDVLFRKAGIPIHNRIIWGKLNPLSYRLMHETREIVIRDIRKLMRMKRMGGSLKTSLRRGEARWESIYRKGSRWFVGT